MSQPHSRIIGLALLLTLVAGCTQDGDAAGDGRGSADGPLVTDRTYETFEGAQVSLRQFAGEPLVVNFWASWCPPCVAEMPEFERVHIARRDQVRLIGLNTQDAVEQARALVGRTGVTYDLGLDPDGGMFRDFAVIAMPSTFFVDAAGVVVHRHAGILSEAQLDALIVEHLVGPGSTR